LTGLEPAKIRDFKSPGCAYLPLDHKG